jgi:hypothetical protein
VTWSNSRGGSANASGTTAWNIPSLTLQPGVNLLTVTARDAAGNSAAATLEVTFAPPSTNALVLMVGQTSGLPGEEVLVPVQVRGFTDINLFQFSLHWTSSVAAFVSVEQYGLAGLAVGNFGTTFANAGTLTVSWDDPDGTSKTLPEDATLFAVRLQLADAAGAETRVWIDGTPTVLEAANSQLAPVPILTVAGQVTIDTPNTAPELAPIEDQTVNLGRTLTVPVEAADAEVPPQTLTFSLLPGGPAGAAVDPASGVFTWTPTEANGVGTYLVRVRVSDNGSPSLSATQSFSVLVLDAKPPPTLAPVPDILASVLVPVWVTNSVADPEARAASSLTYQLAQAPRGARIDRRTGVVFWVPARDQAAASHSFTVIATDDGYPPASATNQFTVAVDDYLELFVGGPIVRVGQAGSLPVTVQSTVGSTNVSATLHVAQARLTGLQAQSLTPEVVANVTAGSTAGEWPLTLRATAGQVLPAGREIAQVNFTAAAGPSAFVPLTLTEVVARQADGQLVPRTLASAGRVVVVGQEPLLDILRAADDLPVVVLYGEPGAEIRVETSPVLGPQAHWQELWRGTMTNLFQVIDPASTNSMGFYRAVRTQ